MVGLGFSKDMGLMRYILKLWKLLRGTSGEFGRTRIMFTLGPLSAVGEPEEVFLVDCFENRRDRLLDDFVLQAQNAQRSFRAISLRNVGTSGRTRSVTSPVHLVVQVL